MNVASTNFSHNPEPGRTEISEIEDRALRNPIIGQMKFMIIARGDIHCDLRVGTGRNILIIGGPIVESFNRKISHFLSLTK
ncbi:hypothetical protein AO063_16930 [Pseudomonas fluorescens ICMP 11288]|uniref:Uncharacterized protein n=1 Tax=Pseudomonas fluorescens ICMP 11288 TaxID=1198309 RepID=A0A0W0HIM9_PSEFL|nr:hypothetical protein AO063_16930 [Pseudomonas fluorescens ICMP 11288]